MRKKQEKLIERVPRMPNKERPKSFMTSCQRPKHFDEKHIRKQIKGILT